MPEITTWAKELNNYAKNDKIIACTLTDKELNEEFDSGFGNPEGRDFTAWSENYVYFPIVYDGAEWVGRAPRHPCNEKTYHHGGY